MAPDGVNFVDKYDAWGVLFALHKQVAHARCADADEHLDEVRAGDRKEGHTGFTRDRTRQQRLAGSRRSYQQHSLRDTAAQLGEALWIAEELDNFLQFVFGLVNTGYIGKGNFMRIFG